jgi:hypothetical protein
MIDVFGVTPSCRINWMPMIAPKIARTISSAKVAGENVEGAADRTRGVRIRP